MIQILKIYRDTGVGRLSMTANYEDGEFPLPTFDTWGEVEGYRRHLKNDIYHCDNIFFKLQEL